MRNDPALEKLQNENSDSEESPITRPENPEETTKDQEVEKDDPWADPDKIGFNRGLEPVKIHESVADSDGQGKCALLSAWGP